MKKLTKILLTWAMMLPLAAWAHDPDQISYHFAKADNTGTLTVHFTPKSALDLLISTKAAFDDGGAIRLADYEANFTQYFNDTIQLRLGGKDIKLEFNTAELGGHDASISFDLKGFEGSFEGLEVTVSSFTEIYRRTSNHLFFPGKEEVVLNLHNQHYSKVNTKATPFHLSILNSPYTLMIIVILSALTIGLRTGAFKKRLPVAAE